MNDEAKRSLTPEDVWWHFGYSGTAQYHSSWENTPEQIERLSALPSMLKTVGMQRRIKVTFDYDPAFPRVLLQISASDPSE